MAEEWRNIPPFGKMFHGAIAASHSSSLPICRFAAFGTALAKREAIRRGSRKEELMPALSRVVFMLTMVGMIATATFTISHGQPAAARHHVLASAAGAAYV
jgi:hypothetical protein